MKQEIMLKCPRCEGSGHVELPAPLVATIAMIPKKGTVTAGQLSKASTEKIGITGWSKRLWNLFLLGLVTRERSGKYWRYSRA